MFRTAKPPRWYQASIIRLFFCLLVGCLAAHFLIEDTLLFMAVAPFDPAAPYAPQANLEEMEHLDDLAYAEFLTGSVVHPAEATAFLVELPCIRQACFPIFQPPKF